MKELHLEFVQVAEEVRMNDDPGRIMLMEHDRDAGRILEVVFSCGNMGLFSKDPPFLPLAPAASSARPSSSFLPHLVSQQPTAGSAALLLVGGRGAYVSA